MENLIMETAALVAEEIRVSILVPVDTVLFQFLGTAPQGFLVLGTLSLLPVIAVGADQVVGYRKGVSTEKTRWVYAYYSERIRFHFSIFQFYRRTLRTLPLPPRKHDVLAIPVINHWYPRYWQPVHGQFLPTWRP